MRTVARNSALMSVRLATNEQRVVEFGRELQRLSASPSPATNDVPAFAPEAVEHADGPAGESGVTMSLSEARLYLANTVAEFVRIRFRKRASQL